MILDVSVHPDDSIFQIKQIILNTATADEQFPLRGCLNPDPNSYYVTYVSQEGSNEEVIAESKFYLSIFFVCIQFEPICILLILSKTTPLRVLTL